MELQFVFDRSEIETLPYRFLCETRECSVWNTGKRRRLWNKEFTKAEQIEAEKIFRQCHQWYLIKGLPDKVTMSASTMALWDRLEIFCSLIQ